jgi:SP family xylose:H+ symportor-like MFS transporter
MFNHGFSYWIYGVMSILAALFVWRYVPETKGRSLEAIQHLWTKQPRELVEGSAKTPATAL